jgi:NodT family efflux transporter outer membrane factor (OMF) lipoprotein
MMNSRKRARIGTPALCGILMLQGCVLGPNYSRPSVPVPATFKEMTPHDMQKLGWKVAEPKDANLHGNWWEIFGDQELNSLEEQVDISNQNVAAAFASFMAARAVVRQAHSKYFPTVTVGLGLTEANSPVTSAGFISGSSDQTFTVYSFPFDASWTPDLWGRVHNTVRSDVAAAQTSEADLENTRLTAQAEVAVDYFELRSQDSLKELLDSTVIAFEQYLKLTKEQYETGIGSAEPVAQAETQLETTRAQDTGVGVLRAQFEHAIALLVGQPASNFSIPVEALKTRRPPAIPFGLPSQLLERRPDIAAAERNMAKANAQIGVARAAYFPTLTLSASAGFQSLDPSSWFTWPSRIWALGPTLSDTIFDAGLRRATVAQTWALYYQSVATYRNTVLTAFQQLEDNLSSLRILALEIQQLDDAVKAAEWNLAMATDRYRLGVDSYLNVTVAQTTLLNTQQRAVSLREQQMVASVQLVEALGGGWDANELPTPQQIISRQPARPEEQTAAEPLAAQADILPGRRSGPGSRAERVRNRRTTIPGGLAGVFSLDCC